MLEVRDYSVSVGNKTLIDHQSISLQPGLLTGLVAPNGSGKTTFMRSLVGVNGIRTAGQLLVDGKRIDAERDYRSSVFYVPGDASTLYPLLTVQDNLLMAQRCWSTCRDFEATIDKCHIRGFLNKRVCKLSLGMKQQVSLAAGYMTGARYLLLDEPMNALDPTNLEVNSNIIRELCRSGAGILMSSHILSNVDDLADEVLFIKDHTFVKSPSTNVGAETMYKQLFG